MQIFLLSKQENFRESTLLLISSFLCEEESTVLKREQKPESGSQNRGRKGIEYSARREREHQVFHYPLETSYQRQLILHNNFLPSLELLKEIMV